MEIHSDSFPHKAFVGFPRNRFIYAILNKYQHDAYVIEGMIDQPLFTFQIVLFIADFNSNVIIPANFITSY